MPLVVEDGTGLANAEAFISAADASTYHTARGNAAWAALASDLVREQFLRRATDHMEQKYRLRWKGTRVTATQALSWPRAFVKREDYYATGTVPPDSINGDFYYPSDEVPVEIGRACAELALRAANGEELTPDTTRRTRREKVDVLEIEYEPGAAQATRWRAVELMLEPFLASVAMRDMERA